MNLILSIAAGGAVGAVLRHFVNIGGSTLFLGFPYSTMVVNIVGSFLMGAAVIAFSQITNLSEDLKAFIIIGVLGSFTTFSAFSYDLFDLCNRGEALQAFTYGFVSVLLSIGGLLAGMMLLKQFVA
ncbi:MAG: fluoride efflux transporter CrcB [Pseudomonadota bacterium]